MPSGYHFRKSRDARIIKLLHGVSNPHASACRTASLHCAICAAVRDLHDPRGGFSATHRTNDQRTELGAWRNACVDLAVRTSVRYRTLSQASQKLSSVRSMLIVAAKVFGRKWGFAWQRSDHFALPHVNELRIGLGFPAWSQSTMLIVPGPRSVVVLLRASPPVSCRAR